jgi:hypothetical protein
MDSGDPNADSAQPSTDSSTIARRGVLAALGLGGLATLGTNSASAQAAGAVGTGSNPVDVYGYSVVANNSFTDPAGVEHTGELADLSDTGAGISVEDNGTQVLADASSLNFGSELDAVDDGDGTTTASVDSAVVSDGDGVDRQIWVIANGASDPAGADAEDIIFEEEA